MVMSAQSNSMLNPYARIGNIVETDKFETLWETVR